jgi:hypothetical protein
MMMMIVILIREWVKKMRINENVPHRMAVSEINPQQV